MVKNKELKTYSPSLKRFFRWLKDNKVYHQWRKNIKIEHFYYVIQNTSPMCFIGDGFVWSNTPEGRDFWMLINDKWICWYLKHKL